MCYNCSITNHNVHFEFMVYELFSINLTKCHLKIKWNYLKETYLLDACVVIRLAIFSGDADVWSCCLGGHVTKIAAGLLLKPRRQWWRRSFYIWFHLLCRKYEIDEVYYMLWRVYSPRRTLLAMTYSWFLST